MLCPIASCTKLIGDVISEVWFVTVKYAIALDTIFACELISTFVLLSASYLATFSLYLSDTSIIFLTVLSILLAYSSWLVICSSVPTLSNVSLMLSFKLVFNSFNSSESVLISLISNGTNVYP